jgi:hypothetical protein
MPIKRSSVSLPSPVSIKNNTEPKNARRYFREICMIEGI